MESKKQLQLLQATIIKGQTNKQNESKYFVNKFQVCYKAS